MSLYFSSLTNALRIQFIAPTMDCNKDSYTHKR